MEPAEWVFKSETTEKEMNELVVWRNETAVSNTDIVRNILGLKTNESSASPIMTRCGPLRKDLEDTSGRGS